MKWMNLHNVYNALVHWMTLVVVYHIFIMQFNQAELGLQPNEFYTSLRDTGRFDISLLNCNDSTIRENNDQAKSHRVPQDEHAN